MGFILVPRLYTKLGERTEKLYLLFGKHRNTRVAMRIAKVQTWSVTGTTRPVSARLCCMKVVSSGLAAAAVLLKLLHLQRSDSWVTIFLPHYEGRRSAEECYLTALHPLDAEE